jgi:hypothetical protein
MGWQLFEVHDQPWFPDFLRREVLDALQMILERTDAYRPIAGRLREALDRAGAREVLDLFSGAGGPWRSLLERFQAQGAAPVEVFLTDKFPIAATSRTGFSLSRTAAQIAEAAGDSKAVPNRLKPVLPRDAAESHLHFVAQPVDATIPCAFRSGFRTIFSSFHHFDRAEARRFLADGAAKGQGIGVFEVVSRRAFTLLSICALPVLTWIYTPRRKPFRWSRLLWTYAMPVVPLVLLFDGLISCIRAYSLADLRALTAGLGGPAGDAAQSYEWQIGEARGARLPLRVTYLIGCPKNSPAQ